jgi:Icc-related predicted phosphoesterase
MKIRYMSDLHLEYTNVEIPCLKDDSETVLVLAGDIGVGQSAGSYINFLRKVAPRFREVLYVLGNHEHYHNNVFNTADMIRCELSRFSILSNVTVLDNEIHEIDGITIIGSTLWTDFNGRDERLMENAPKITNDFNMIRIGNPFHLPLTPAAMATLNEKSREFVLNEIHEASLLCRDAVIITHYPPSRKCSHERFNKPEFEDINNIYTNDLENILTRYDNIPLWFHGHIHDNVDIRISDTRILCNPYGFSRGKTNKSFDLKNIVEI